VERLPIDDHLPAILDRVRAARALVLSAPPGAGKTTRVPVALVADGPVIVLQPRRVAARAIARRIADEQRWTLGEDIGWHVRFERRFSSRTRVLLATEGILTARLQQDPLLSEFRTVVLDEFHERSVHADLGLALVRQTWRAREDLQLVVMSATLDTGMVAHFLDDCPVVRVPGRPHPVTVDHRPDQTIAAAAAELLHETTGHALCFLPGAPEIRRALPDVQRAAGNDVTVLPLHGSLSADEQDRALQDGAGRRVILATNIAETSLTVRGVTCVIDTGLQKVARYDPDRGIDSLETERITLDSAEQRAGRAGRLGPGRVRRLWNERDTLRPHREAEIHRVDLSDPVLAIRGWGGDPATLEWFETPDPERIAAAEELLQRLGALERGLLTDLGRQLQRLPLHPRLARMLIEGAGDLRVALACALLSERHFVPARAAATASDLMSAVDDERGLPPAVVALGRRLSRLVAAGGAMTPGDRETRFLRAVFVGYPDRVARRRKSGSARFLFASGTGGVLAPESGVHNTQFVVAVDVQAGRRGEGSEARIRLASAIDAAWLAPTRVAIEHELDERTGRVRAVERAFYGELRLRERVVEPDVDETSRLLREAYLKRPLQDQDVQLQRRLRFAGIDVAFEALVARAATSAASVSEINPENALDWNTRRNLDRIAPQTLNVPSGRAVRLEYQEDGAIGAAVKLQELFGLGDSPRFGPHQTPVVFALLAPNGRPVQTTRDLRSFWNTTYQEVRGALRGRYPKHPWPEDPWTATATARTIKKRRSSTGNVT
jgi:ATP-dependent helicase HrpB